MTYVLRERVKNRYYCKDHNKIIEFDTLDEARNFLTQFEQIAMTIAMGQIMMNPGILQEVQQVCQSTTIDKKPPCNCEFVNYKTLKR